VRGLLYVNPSSKYFFILDKTFVISDTWFNRPYNEHYGENHLEYNRNIVTKWNDVVSENDTVYVLGGFGISDLYDAVFQLNGNIIFLNTFFSNDEVESRNNLMDAVEKSINNELKNRVIFSPNQVEILKDKDIVLSYFPLLDWYGKKNGSLCFHGMNETTNMNNSNICCNASKWDFKPVNLDEVATNIAKFKSMI
jgi:calcineurin-like phosphoesterase family protein